jgi:hypothetical protein
MTTLIKRKRHLAQPEHQASLDAMLRRYDEQERKEKQAALERIHREIATMKRWGRKGMQWAAAR